MEPGIVEPGRFQGRGQSKNVARSLAMEKNKIMVPVYPEKGGRIMTVASLFQDIQMLGLFMLAGFVLRELVKPIQKLYIPTAMLGGMVALVLGQQVLGLVQVPDTFGSYSGVLIEVVLTCTAFGVTFDKSRIRNYADYTFGSILIYGTQLLIGAPLGQFLRRFWPSLPDGWGILGCCAFWGGHGTASAAGGVLEELGSEGSMAMGMILSTVGLIVAVTAGIILINWGIRRQYTMYTKVSARGQDTTLGGVLPPEEQRPIGLVKTAPAGINALVLQFSFVMLCMWLGSRIIALCGFVVPAFNQIPLLVHGMIGAVVVRFVMHVTRTEGYMDTASISTISGFTLDVIIISAIATLKLSMFSDFMVPILLFSLVLLSATLLLAVCFMKYVSRHEWFEKACCLFGMSSGAVPTGLALVRCVDPEGKSSVPDAQGVSSTVFTPVSGVMPALLPALILTSVNSVLGIAAVLVAVPLVGGILLHRKKGGR